MSKQPPSATAERIVKALLLYFYPRERGTAGVMAQVVADSGLAELERLRAAAELACVSMEERGYGDMPSIENLRAALDRVQQFPEPPA